jgi:hypothetical protein
MLDYESNALRFILDMADFRGDSATTIEHYRTCRKAASGGAALICSAEERMLVLRYIDHCIRQLTADGI